MSNSENWIWGEHSVKACFECTPEQIQEVFVERQAHGRLWNFFEELKAGHSASIVERLPRFLAERRTQGIAAKIKNFPVHRIDTFYEKFPTLDAKGSQFLILDRIQDPQNFGAILRSAAALGALNVLVGQREQCPVTGTVAQVSAGNLFRLQIYTSPNLVKSCEFLSENGVKILALEKAGEDIRIVVKDLARQSIAWILGAEDDGIQSALLKTVYKKVGIPMMENVESLNVSNSAAIALFAGNERNKNH